MPAALDLWGPIDRLRQLVVNPVKLRPISTNGVLQARSMLDGTVLAEFTAYSFKRMGPLS